MAYRDNAARNDDLDERSSRTDLDDGIDIRRGTLRDPGVDEAHRMFGGMDVGGQLVGMLTALALTLLLSGLIGAAVGTVAFQTGIDEQLDATTTEASIGAVIGGIVVLALAFLAGGWAAGRIARYDGARNGAMVGVWFLVLGLVLGALGAWAGDEFNVVQRVDLLPDWFGTWFEGDVAIGAIVSGLIAIAVIVLAGALGGKLGERYHRRADEVIAANRRGGIVEARREGIR